MTEVRTFRRHVMARRDTRRAAELIAEELANPVGDVEIIGEYAVEYTPVFGQREQWRVVHLTDVPECTPDVHPGTESHLKACRGQLSDYESPSWW